MNVSFNCLTCEWPARVDFDGATLWQCPVCEERITLQEHSGEGPLQDCVICGNPELYKKKDFPHWLGMLILVGACSLSVITYWLYHQWLTWAILIGSAAVDGLLYLSVGDVIVCYRCNSHYRRVAPQSVHQPFDLGIAERYRQERIRREHLRGVRKAT